MPAGIIAGMFALPLLAPRWLLLAIPPYLANVLSGHAPQHLWFLHYVMLLLFPLIVAGGVGARRFLEMRSIRPAYALVAVIPALLLSWGTGRFPPMLGSSSTDYSRPNEVAQLERATSLIPADAPVSADNGLAVWLANRHTINDFPDKLDATCYVVLERNAYVQFRNPTDTNNPAVRQTALNSRPASRRRPLYPCAPFSPPTPLVNQPSPTPA